MFKNFIRSLTFRKPGLYLAATGKAVVLFHQGNKIVITPDLAEKLAVELPRYAQLSRSLAGAAQKAVSEAA